MPPLLVDVDWRFDWRCFPVLRRRCFRCSGGAATLSLPSNPFPSRSTRRRRRGCHCRRAWRRCPRPWPAHPAHSLVASLPLAACAPHAASANASSLCPVLSLPLSIPSAYPQPSAHLLSLPYPKHTAYPKPPGVRLPSLDRHQGGQAASHGFKHRLKLNQSSSRHDTGKMQLSFRGNTLSLGTWPLKGEGFDEGQQWFDKMHELLDPMRDRELSPQEEKSVQDAKLACQQAGLASVSRQQ